MRIEDDELRDLFKITSEERIQAIDNGLLQLEQTPDDLTPIEGILREAHSLKGDSNMLGQEDLGTLAHQIEHILGSVRRGEIPFTHELGDRLAHGMDAIRKLVNEAVTGESTGINAFYILAELMGGQSSEDSVVTGASLAVDSDVPVDKTSGAEATSDQLSTDQSWTQPRATDEGHQNGQPHRTSDRTSGLFKQDASSQPERRLETIAEETAETVFATKGERVDQSGYRIETVRVPTCTLDSLMTEAGELTVTKIRVAHRMAEVEALTNLWEDWNRDMFVNRFLFDSYQTSAVQDHQIHSFLSRAEANVEQLGELSTRLRSSLYEDIARLEMISDKLEEGVRTLRLLPLSTIFNLFPRMVRDLARQEGKEVELLLEGGETKADKRILEEMKDPLMHMLRNAIDHGIETPAERVQVGKPEKAMLKLRGYQSGNTIVLEVSDDGRGLSLESIKEMAVRKGLYRPEELDELKPEQIQALILSPGFSTRMMVTEVSGRGVGLDVLRSNVERLKGHIDIESQPGRGCTLRVRLGTTLATAHVLIVSVAGMRYALPVEFVDTARLVDPAEIFTVKGLPAVLQNGQPVSVLPLGHLLELDTPSAPDKPEETHQLACIMLKVGNERLGVFVDDLVDEQDVVLKPQSRLLARVRNVAGATILGTGEVCMVLNPQDLIQSARRGRKGAIATANTPLASPEQLSHVRRSVLLVEDSIATRTQEKRILEAAGYTVVTAVDGLDGFSKLQMQPFDAVISDVQMPNLDGLGLTTRIRQHREYNEIPVILVTTLASDDDRRRGAEAGANAYITKSSFNQDILLDTLERLI